MKDNSQDTQIISRIDDAINQLENNKFTLYFFIVDSKNIPNGSMYYTYQLAKTLNDKGYNVQMLYNLPNEYTASELYHLQKKEKPVDPSRTFVGVGEWLGKEYAELPHLNIATSQWSVKPSDFLFIPEAITSIMRETYRRKVPCKRFVLQHNFNNITEFMPLGVGFDRYGITDIVTTSETQSNLTKKLFPYVNTRVLPPCVLPIFKAPETGKKLIVNIVSKNQSNINRVIKQFYLKYPIYKFVSFRDVRDLPLSKLAETLQESPITVWMDEYTPFGYSALAALRCGNIVIGKVPEVAPDWMQKDDTLAYNGIWCYDINRIPDYVAKAVAAFLNGDDEEFVTEDIVDTNQKYTLAEWSENVENFILDVVKERTHEFANIKERYVSGFNIDAEIIEEQPKKEEL